MTDDSHVGDKQKNKGKISRVISGGLSHAIKTLKSHPIKTGLATIAGSMALAHHLGDKELSNPDYKPTASHIAKRIAANTGFIGGGLSAMYGVGKYVRKKMKSKSVPTDKPKEDVTSEYQ